MGLFIRTEGGLEPKGGLEPEGGLEAQGGLEPEGGLEPRGGFESVGGLEIAVSPRTGGGGGARRLMGLSRVAARGIFLWAPFSCSEF